MMLDHSSASPHYVKTKKLLTKSNAHRVEHNIIEQLYNCLNFSSKSSDTVKADGFPTLLN